MEDDKICVGDGHGLFLPLFDGENQWDLSFRKGLYLSLLLWCFLGVAIVADIFMAAIECITSQEKKVHMSIKGKTETYFLKTWNPTVANLTLMALGSSAPEILLSCIELFGNNFHSGELGPSTIVGSAAYNLLMIIAICVAAIPAGQSRKIKAMGVYVCTVVASLGAYIWLVYILSVSSPDMIEVWEGALTFLFMPVLVLVAYLLDIGYFDQKKKRLGNTHVHGISDSDHVKLHPDVLASMIAELKLKYGGDIDVDNPEVLAQLIQEKMSAEVPRSRAYYRVQATRSMTAGKRIAGQAGAQLESAGKLVGNVIGLSSRESGRGKLIGNVIGFLPGRGYKALEEEGKAPTNKQSKTKRPATMSFASAQYAVVESAGKVQVEVVRTGNLHCKASCDYKSVDGEAKAGHDYTAVSGRLEFDVGQTTKTFMIQIVDDHGYEPDEHFSVQLFNPTTDFYACPAELGENGSAVIVIIDDDFAGRLEFGRTEMSVQESDGSITLSVKRVGGSSGAVSCMYTTLDGTAHGGCDFIHTKGRLTFKHGELSKTIVVGIIDDEQYEKNEYFRVKAYDAAGGVKFGNGADGVALEAITCEIEIKSDDVLADKVNSVSQLLESSGIMSCHVYAKGAESWAEQFKDAISVHGGDDEGESKPSALDWLLHVATLPFKLIFALIPPTIYYEGKLTFLVALVAIGLLTAVIGDVASLFGCVVGLPDSVTAITFVALGTSLPDTFASKTAAVSDPTADAAIVNVTGSNAVNVFLGLGLPWLIGAIYWWLQGATPEWQARYPDLVSSYPNGGFAVYAGDLTFSVVVFVSCASICLICLAIRRVVLGAELGGPERPKYVSAAFFATLWGVYIALSCWKTFSGMDA